MKTLTLTTNTARGREVLKLKGSVNAKVLTDEEISKRIKPLKKN